MAGQNINLDREFLSRYAAFEKDIPKVVSRALTLTNRWLRAVTMAELKFELQISAKALTSRFLTFRHGKTPKFWIGLNEIGVHRIGRPVQESAGVRVGSHFYDDAFITPMNSDELLVFRRTGKKLQLVTEDISHDTEDVVNNYLPEINRKFQEFFSREFRNVLSLSR